MSGNVVNLRTARKRRARQAQDAKAAQNRVIFDQTKAEKQARKANTEIERRRHDQLQRQPRDGNDET